MELQTIPVFSIYKHSHKPHERERRKNRPHPRRHAQHEEDDDRRTDSGDGHISYVA